MQPNEKKALIETLEADGEQRVREKLADGVYGRRKLDTIHQWLEELDLPGKELGRIAQEKQDRFDRRMPVWSVLIGLLAIAVTMFLAIEL